MKFGVRDPTLFLDLDRASAPVANPDQLVLPTGITPWRNCSKVPCGALNLHDAVAIDALRHGKRPAVCHSLRCGRIIHQPEVWMSKRVRKDETTRPTTGSSHNHDQNQDAVDKDV